jgi:hypothetical protein
MREQEQEELGGNTGKQLNYSDSINGITGAPLKIQFS